MQPITFEIVNARKRKAEPCALLFYSPSKDTFSIEIAERATARDVPALFLPFIERGERTIDEKWSRRWVQERLCPPGRQNLGEVLRAHGLQEYDELALLRSSCAKSSQDDFVVHEVAESKANRTNGGAPALNASLGSALKARRKELGLSQSDVGRLARVGQPVISRLERGLQNATLELVADVCQALDLEPNFSFAKSPHEARATV